MLLLCIFTISIFAQTIDGIPNQVVTGLPNSSLSNASITVNGQTCTLGSSCNPNNGATTHGVTLNEGNGSAMGGTAVGTAHQVLASAGSADPGYQDLRDVKVIPFAAAPAGTAAAGISYATGQWTPTARAGTNNIGAALQAIPSSGATLQFLVELPLDWDTANQPYLSIFFGSGANTSGTVIWTVSSGCSKRDGSVSDDPTLNAESAFATKTMATANRMWASNGQYTAITSGNNCIPGGSVIVKAVLSGTASSAINAYQAVISIPILPISGQAN